MLSAGATNRHFVYLIVDFWFLVVVGIFYFFSSKSPTATNNQSRDGNQIPHFRKVQMLFFSRGPA